MGYHRYKFEDKKIDSEHLQINLLYITQASYEPGWEESVIHTHHFTELFYVVSGKGKFMANDRFFPIQTNDMIIVNPNVSHAEYVSGDTKLEYIVLGIDNLQFSFRGSKGLEGYQISSLHANKDEVFLYLRQILREVQDKEDNYEIICRNLLECLVYFLSRKTKSSLSFEASKRTLKECRFIEQYLDEHFSENITLQTLSNITYMNKYYLGHAFKEYKGMSPINYLIKRRIQEAENLLETSNYSIAKISHAVGFSSQSYFTQVFRKEKGISPNQYRRQAAAEE